MSVFWHSFISPIVPLVISEKVMLSHSPGRLAVVRFPVRLCALCPRCEQWLWGADLGHSRWDSQIVSGDLPKFYCTEEVLFLFCFHDLLLPKLDPFFCIPSSHTLQQYINPTWTARKRYKHFMLGFAFTVKCCFRFSVGQLYAIPAFSYLHKSLDLIFCWGTNINVCRNVTHCIWGHVLEQEHESYSTL